MKVKVIIDHEKITVRRRAQFFKDIAGLDEIKDPLERIEGKAKVWAGLTENLSAEDVLNLSTRDFEEFDQLLADALSGKVPN
jgi:hypothetical protein